VKWPATHEGNDVYMRAAMYLQYLICSPCGHLLRALPHDLISASGHVVALNHRVYIFTTCNNSQYNAPSVALALAFDSRHAAVALSHMCSTRIASRCACLRVSHSCSRCAGSLFAPTLTGLPPLLGSETSTPAADWA
jgi:hypothetical protein